MSETDESGTGSSIDPRVGSHRARPPAGDNDRTANRDIVPVHRCISCCEPIHADAHVCPHCRTSQLPQRWQLIGKTLKWIGGITAVISLVIGAVRVNELYGNWRETHNTVQEMVYVSGQLLATHDYQGGWKLLGEALTLQPTSPAARRFQEQFAMTWLQDIHKSEEVSWAEVVDPLIPVLYRATLNKEKQRTADAYAYIGWANYLKNRDAGTRRYEVETLYKQALTIDPDNAYAHAYLAHWLLNYLNRESVNPETMQSAMMHIEAATASGRQPEYFYNLALVALLENKDAFKKVLSHALVIADRARRANVAVALSLRLDLLNAASRLDYYSPTPFDEKRLKALAEHLPIVDLSATWRWLMAGTADRDQLSFTYVLARLSYAAGEKRKALELYRGLQKSGLLPGTMPDVVDAAVERLTSELENP